MRNHWDESLNLSLNVTIVLQIVKLLIKMAKMRKEDKGLMSLIETLKEPRESVELRLNLLNPKRWEARASRASFVLSWCNFFPGLWRTRMMLILRPIEVGESAELHCNDLKCSGHWNADSDHSVCSQSWVMARNMPQSLCRCIWTDTLCLWVLSLNEDVQSWVTARNLRAKLQMLVHKADWCCLPGL